MKQLRTHHSAPPPRAGDAGLDNPAAAGAVPAGNLSEPMPPKVVGGLLVNLHPPRCGDAGLDCPALGALSGTCRLSRLSWILLKPIEMRSLSVTSARSAISSTPSSAGAGVWAWNLFVASGVVARRARPLSDHENLQGQTLIHDSNFQFPQWPL